MRTIALVVFLMAQNRGPAKTETPGPVLSVCEVLADDPTKFNGKLIALEGEFVYGTEGMWLVGEGCKTQLVTKGLKWGHDIAVSVDPGIDSVAISWERLTKRLQRLRVKPDDKLMVTIVGRLETRDSLNDMVIQMPYGLRHFGFGHMGDSPAEINVVSIEFKQLKRERNPQKTRKRPAKEMICSCAEMQSRPLRLWSRMRTVTSFDGNRIHPGRICRGAQPAHGAPYDYVTRSGCRLVLGYVQAGLGVMFFMPML